VKYLFHILNCLENEQRIIKKAQRMCPSDNKDNRLKDSFHLLSTDKRKVIRKNMQRRTIRGKLQNIPPPPQK